MAPNTAGWLWGEHWDSALCGSWAPAAGWGPAAPPRAVLHGATSSPQASSDQGCQPGRCPTAVLFIPLSHQRLWLWDPAARVPPPNPSRQCLGFVAQWFCEPVSENFHLPPNSNANINCVINWVVIPSQGCEWSHRSMGLPREQRTAVEKWIYVLL